MTDAAPTTSAHHGTSPSRVVEPASLGPTDADGAAPPLAPDDFAALLQTERLDDVVRDILFEGVPFVFAATPVLWTGLRHSLAADLGCEPHDVIVVGSAKMGYSLAPRKYGRPFASNSDIDVIVISCELYDRVWLSVLRWHYRRRYRLPPTDRIWDDERRKSLYWGYLNPTGFKYSGVSRAAQLKPAKDVSVAWFNAFKRLGLTPDLAGRTVTGRLYRSREHAVCYHDHGLRELRTMLANDRSDGADGLQ